MEKNFKYLLKDMKNIEILNNISSTQLQSNDQKVFTIFDKLFPQYV